VLKLKEERQKKIIAEAGLAERKKKILTIKWAEIVR
jgi:hypothetical protein